LRKRRKKKFKDRYRNRFFRLIGVLPYDDFNYYADDVLAVLENFEGFTRRTAKFATIVAGKLKIKNWKDEIKKLKEEIAKDDYGDMFG
jgi:hypothetical protein